MVYPIVSEHPAKKIRVSVSEHSIRVWGEDDAKPASIYLSGGGEGMPDVCVEDGYIRVFRKGQKKGVDYFVYTTVRSNGAKGTRIDVK